MLGVLALPAFVAPGLFVRRVLDAESVQVGVGAVLAEEYGITGVTAVTCPAGVPVEVGAGADCRARIGGAEVGVPVRVLDRDGTYEVGRPR